MTDTQTRCPWDTDGDGNCHLCVRRPEGCPVAKIKADLAEARERIIALEAERQEIVVYYEGMSDERDVDLAEALALLEVLLRNGYVDDVRSGLRFLAKHGRFRILRDDDWTEGEWVSP